jgi:hypothetical protein
LGAARFVAPVFVEGIDMNSARFSKRFSGTVLVGTSILCIVVFLAAATPVRMADPENPPAPAKPAADKPEPGKDADKAVPHKDAGHVEPRKEPPLKDPTIPSPKMQELLSNGAYPPALRWIDERSKFCVLRVLARDFSVDAVDVRQWSPEGLEAFIKDFEKNFKKQSETPSFWDYDYLAYHQERLKLRARQAGIPYDYSEKRPEPEDFLLERSLWAQFKKLRDKMDDASKFQRQLEENRSKRPPIQVGPSDQPRTTQPPARGPLGKPPTPPGPAEPQNKDLILLPQ